MRHSPNPIVKGRYALSPYLSFKAKNTFGCIQPHIQLVKLKNEVPVTTNSGGKISALAYQITGPNPIQNPAM